MPRFYLTTAIDYANGDPHLGHALEKIGADVIARRIQEAALAIAALSVEADPQVGARISVSQGLALMSGTDSSTSLLERAAKALSGARKRGGNLIHS